MARRRRRKEEKDVAGRIIGILFLLMAIAGGYMLFDMFRTVEVTKANIYGEWKQTTSPLVYWTFNMDGTAKSYTRENGSTEIRNQKTYTYVLDEETKTITLTTTRKDEEVTFKISSLSKIQMHMLQNGVDFGQMTRANLF